MEDDEVLKEIRKYREEYAANFGYDLEAIFADIKAKEERGGRRVVSLPPKPPVSEPLAKAS